MGRSDGRYRPAFLSRPRHGEIVSRSSAKKWNERLTPTRFRLELLIESDWGRFGKNAIQYLPAPGENWRNPQRRPRKIVALNITKNSRFRRELRRISYCYLHRPTPGSVLRFFSMGVGAPFA